MENQGSHSFFVFVYVMAENCGGVRKSHILGSFLFLQIRGFKGEVVGRLGRKHLFQGSGACFFEEMKWLPLLFADSLGNLEGVMRVDGGYKNNPIRRLDHLLEIFPPLLAVAAMIAAAGSKPFHYAPVLLFEPGKPPDDGNGGI